MVGEIGGDAEERAADFIAEQVRSPSSPTSPASPRRRASRWAMRARSSRAPRAPRRQRSRRSRRRACGSARARPRPLSSPSRRCAPPPSGVGKVGPPWPLTRSPSPAALRAPTSSPRRPSARQRARRSRTTGASTLLRHGPRSSGPLRVDRRRAARDRRRPGDGHQRLDEAAALLFRYMIEPGDRVIVEQPSYDRTLLLLGRTGAELIPVALEPDGIEIEGLERALSEGPVALAHVIPNYHNPAGARCRREARAPRRARGRARLHPLRGRSLPADQLRRTLLPTMLSLDRADRVIHASSFSKTVSPGVRVGYLAGPQEQIATLAKRGSEHYISPNMLAESVVLEMCRFGGLRRNIEVVNEALRERRDALVKALGAHLPEARFVVPEGGYFLWLGPRQRHRHARPAGGGQGGGRRLRRRTRLHARRRRVEPAPLLCQRAGRAGRRGRQSPGQALETLRASARPSARHRARDDALFSSN